MMSEEEIKQLIADVYEYRTSLWECLSREFAENNTSGYDHTMRRIQRADERIRVLEEVLK